MLSQALQYSSFGSASGFNAPLEWNWVDYIRKLSLIHETIRDMLLFISKSSSKFVYVLKGKGKMGKIRQLMFKDLVLEFGAKQPYENLLKLLS